jgi:hypothetical protein
MSFIKERDPQITKLNLVLTFNVGPKANPNASTHTNYLITLLKSEYTKGVRFIFETNIS